jgi:hypothetical protein
MTFKPLNTLTILDYRNLADAVHRFDPGPHTTHYAGAPDPEPEDLGTQILGMADVIRNEESYKNDANLFGLPDAAMIFFWALKSSPNIEFLPA